jgi:probable F420-dependent oxidoreductase
MPTNHPRPFRFGILAEHAVSRSTLLETARRAEDAGFDTLLLRDHFIEEPFGHQLAPFPALTAVAAVTERLRVGTLVCANDYRHPVMLAKEAATLDLLSEGRFELGLGAGFSQAEYDQAGMPFDRPGVRVDRLQEAIQVIKRIWATTPGTFTGELYTVTGLDGFPKPVQRPRPPIHIGGAGRRMLSLAAREADIVGIQSVSTTSGSVNNAAQHRLAAKVAEQVDWVRQVAGDRLSDLELSTTATFIISDDRHTAAADLAHQRDWQDVSTDDVLAMPAVHIGTVDQIIETLHSRREQLGITYYVIDDTNLAAAAPVVARLLTT